ncbi:MAG: DUF3502 domain-containing protein [Ruminococcaceae bacterium]|nr:DUF3502 domain-containing protein [Oscillospiraceae bacterium]
MKRIITVLLVVLLCWAVTACDEEKANEKDIVSSMVNSCITENGIYHISRESRKKLCFADFETGYDIVLCNKPECAHELYNGKTNPLPTCNAVTMHGEDYYGMIVYKDVLYTVENSINTNELYINKSNLDGSGKSTVATIKGWFMQNGVTPIICANGYMYYVGWDYSADMGEGEPDFNKLVESLYKIELSTGKVEKLIEKESGNGIYKFINLYTDGKKLYYNINNSISEYDETTASYQVKEWITDFYFYDLETGTEKQENAEGEYKGIVGICDDYSRVIEEYIEGKKVLTNNGRIIHEVGDREIFFVAEDKLIVRKIVGDLYTIIDIETAQIEKQFKGEGKVIIGSGEKYLVAKNITNDDFAIVSKDNFYKGNAYWNPVAQKIGTNENPITASPQATPTEMPLWEKVSAEMNEKYADKTRLVWYMNGALINSSEDFARMINEYLDKKGYDFFVDLYYTNGDWSEYNFTKSLKENKIQADIISTGFCIDPIGDSYYAYARDGLFAPMTEFFETESGKELRAFYNEKIWKSAEINGEVYGVTKRMAYEYDKVYVFNKAILDKYELSVDDFTGDLEKDYELFKRVYDAEIKENPDFVTVLFNENRNMMPYDRVMSNSTSPKCIVAKIGDENGGILNFYEQSDVSATLHTVKKYMDSGFCKTGNLPADMHNFFCIYTLSEKKYEMREIAQRSAPTNQQGEYLPLPDDLMVAGKWLEATSQVLTAVERCFGVASWSEHKDEAFEVIKLMSTDAEFANILMYGKEGSTYEIADGKVVYTSNSSGVSSRTWFFNDELLLLPRKGEAENKAEIYRQLYEKAETSAVTGFHYDNPETLELQQTIGRIEQEYAGLWNGAYEDVDATLAELNAKLYEAGLQTLLDDINTQYEAWKSIK